MANLVDPSLLINISHGYARTRNFGSRGSWRTFSAKGAIALSLYQPEMTSQFSAVLTNLVARFAAFEWREQRVCKVSPCNPQQFLQPVYIAGQNL
ncbi:MAG: hypothetical protein JWP25_1929 [Bradyrhizobium sp.]|jgi:hypothetical protein|nr:hypothetical protein [Bradyrhizobium sp.]